MSKVIASPSRSFRQLIGRDGMKSDILECEPDNPRPYFTIVKPPRRTGCMAYGTLADSPPSEERRFRFRREILVRLFEYEED